jgi:hypothetical protein
MGSVRYQVVEKNGKEIVEEIHKVVFHKIRMGDVEDPDLFVAQPIWEWQQTEAGKFVMSNSINGTPEWHRHVDHLTYGHIYLIIAEMEMKKLSEYYLRWGHPS